MNKNFGIKCEFGLREGGPTRRKRHSKTVEVPVVNERRWLCTECRKPIADGKGYIEFDNTEPSRRPAGGRHRAPRCVPTSDLDGPDRYLGMRVVHVACDEDQHFTYHIDVERIRTADEALDWTRHMLGKIWFGAAEAGEFLDMCLGRHESQRTPKEDPS